MALIALDIDGTIESQNEKSEYVNGPIKIADLFLLEDAHFICLVSPSPFYPRLEDNITPMFPIFAKWGSDTMRWKNLIDAEKHWKESQFGDDLQLKLYVSNNKDYNEAKKAGFAYIEADQFANMIPHNTPEENGPPW